jgi:hypothetical protein
MEITPDAAAGAGQAITVRLNVRDARCRALFASWLHPPDAPTA